MPFTSTTNEGQIQNFGNRSRGNLDGRHEQLGKRRRHKEHSKRKLSNEPSQMRWRKASLQMLKKRRSSS